MNPPQRKPKKTPNAPRLWLFRIFAIGFPLLILLLLELALRVAGTGYPTSFLISHPSKAGYLVDNYKFAWRFFPKALARAPRPIVVQKQKATGTTRIVVFGGSAAMGDPEPAYGMPRVLDVLLEARFPKREFEVINCAVTAINSHVVREIARDCRGLNADAWVVYLGNNEVHGPFGAGTVFGNHDRPLWLNRMILAFQKLKLGQATSALAASSKNSATPKRWGGMEMFLEQKVRGDNPELQRVYNNFEQNLKGITGERGNGTEIVLSTVVTNLKDFPPFVSMHRDSLSKPDLSEWEKQYERGCVLQSAGDSEAPSAFQAAERLDATYAELAFRQAQCLLKKGDDEAALEAFARARDLDALRFRADTRINQIIRDVANETESEFVDAANLLASQSPDGIVGDNFLHEHVHLNFAGNYALAKELAKALAVRCGFLTDADSGTEDRWLSQEACVLALGMSPFHERLTLQDVRGRLNLPPFNTQLGHSQRDAKLAARMSDLSSEMTPASGQAASQQIATVLAARPDDWLLRQQYAMLLDSMGDKEGAEAQYQQVADQLPHNAESQFRLGAQQNRLKKREAAEKTLRKVLQLRPDFARANNSLGICLSHQERFKECYEEFARAVELQPTFAEAYVNWGLVLANQGDETAAAEKYKLATEADENYAPGHDQLGRVYVKANNYQDAMPHYEAVARLLPYDVSAQLNLGMLYLRFGGHEEQAEKQFRRTLELSPTNQVATEGLRRLEAAHQ